MPVPVCGVWPSVVRRGVGSVSVSLCGHESARAGQSWFDSLDKDKDGSLSLEEKLAGATPRPRRRAPRVRTLPEC